MRRTAQRIWRHPGNRGRRFRRLGAWLGWQIWERAVRRPWMVTMPPDIHLKLAPHDPVTSAVLYCGVPDWAEMRFVRDYLRDGDVMVDVGANVGLYALLGARTGDIRVIAFEPNDIARARAVENAARNGLSQRVQFRPQAVGGVPGRSSFTAAQGPLNHLVKSPVTEAQPVHPVDVVTLDDVVDGPVALIKVDVEGDELGVLRGAEGLLRTFGPALVVEANDPPALTAWLEAFGYQWVSYAPEGRRVGAVPSPGVGENGIAVTDLAATTARLDRSSTFG